MAETINLVNFQNLTNQPSAVAGMNSNNAVIASALTDVISRSGVQPNQMNSTLDMNSNRVINLVTPTSVTEPMTLGYFNSLATGANLITGTSTAVPISAAMQPVVNASSTAAALSLLGGASVSTYIPEGMQINGDMVLSQENAVSSVNLVSGTDKYIVDGTVGGFHSSTMVVTGQQITPPGSPSFGNAFSSCIQLKSTTGAAMGASDYIGFHQAIEGVRFTRAAFGAAGAYTCTIGFWIYATIAGTVAVSLRNGPAVTPNRSYVVDVVINNPATWEYKTVQIPGDTAGTWLNGAGQIGVFLDIIAGCGATYQATPGAWTAGNFIGTPNTTNFFASNNNVVCITGLFILPGIFSISAVFTPILFRESSDSISICQRYYERSYPLGIALGAVTNAGISYAFLAGLTNGTLQGGSMVPYKVVKCTSSPTLTFYSPVTGIAGKVRDFQAATDIAVFVNATSDASFQWTGTSAAATSTTLNMGVHWVSDCRL